MFLIDLLFGPMSSSIQSWQLLYRHRPVADATFRRWFLLLPVPGWSRGGSGVTSWNGRKRCRCRSSPVSTRRECATESLRCTASTYYLYIYLFIYLYNVNIVHEHIRKEKEKRKNIKNKQMKNNMYVCVTMYVCLLPVSNLIDIRTARFLEEFTINENHVCTCLLYTSPSPRD